MSVPNLPSLISRFEAALPGWKCPTDIGIDHRSNNACAFYLFGHGNRFFIPIDHAAAIIERSVKDWLTTNYIGYQVQRGAEGGVASLVQASVWGKYDGCYNASAPTELEALCAAVEGMSKSK